MKTVAIYIMWIIGCTFLSYMVMMVIVVALIETIPKLFHQAELFFGIRLLSIFLDGPAIGCLGAWHSTRTKKKASTATSTDDPSS
jgi:hypothetical protein